MCIRDSIYIYAGAVTGLGQTGGGVDIKSGAGASTSSGMVTIQTVNSGDDGSSGCLALATGTSADRSGGIILSTGDSTEANTGRIEVNVGASASGSGGFISMTGGESTGGAGSYGGSIAMPLAVGELLAMSRSLGENPGVLRQKVALST